MANEMVVKEQGALAVAQEERTVAEVIAQMHKVQELMSQAMVKDEHYGVIPGTGNKPTLLKAGAEKLCFLFRLAPSYIHVKEQDGNHLTVESTCTLTHINSGRLVATGSGLCSTRESKYAWRKASLKCPNCGKENIRRSKNKDKTGDQGWYCWNQTGGCGTNYKSTDPMIVGQEVGRVANEDLADQWNTIIKMADKRALIAAVLNGTAASDIFTQDLEDLAGKMPVEPPADDETGDDAKSGEKTAGKAVSGAKAGTPATADKPPVETTATKVEESGPAGPPAGLDGGDPKMASAAQKKWFAEACTATRLSPMLALNQRQHKTVDELTSDDIKWYDEFFRKRAAKKAA